MIEIAILPTVMNIAITKELNIITWTGAPRARVPSPENQAWR